MKLEVGQKLWYVPNSSRDNQQEVTIQNIGRKWAKADYVSKIDINTLEVNGGQYSSPGRCYLSKEEYDNYVLIRSVWTELAKKITMYKLPDGMTLEKIDAIRELVFGGDDEKVS